MQDVVLRMRFANRFHIVNAPYSKILHGAKKYFLKSLLFNRKRIGEYKRPYPEIYFT